MIEISNFANALHPIIKAFKTHTPSTSLIFIDGFPDAGKTELAKLLKEILLAIHIEVDDFILPEGCGNQQYVEHVKQTDVKNILTDATKNNKTVIVDGICMNDVFPIDEFPAFRIYIRRSQQFKIVKRLHEQVYSYHQIFSPEKCAQMIITNTYNLDNSHQTQ